MADSSPHVSIAWNPQFNGGLGEKIFREEQYRDPCGGYGRIYGRLNGVDLMLVPLRFGPGLLQAVACVGPTITNSAAGRAARRFSLHSASVWTAWLRRCLR